MSQPRPGDDPHTAALRAMLRDPALMADVIANLGDWEPTEEQRHTIAALLHPPTARR